MNRIPFVIAAAVLCAGSALAQVRESMTVSVVEVPVTVFDAHGNPVRGLTAANFEVLDDGVKRPVTSFDVFDFGAAQGNALARMQSAARRNFLVLFDLSNSAPVALSRAQEAARNFIGQNVQPSDLVAVGTLDPDLSFRMLTSFTTDRTALLAAMADPVAFRGSDPLGLTNHTDIFTPATEIAIGFDKAQMASEGRGGKYSGDAAEHQRDLSQMFKHEHEASVRERIERQINALTEIAATLRSVPGRKQLLYLSEGFDATALVGRDVRLTKDLTDENAAVLAGEVWKVDNDRRYGNTGSSSLLTRMADYFRRSDVVLNAIDIQGVRMQSDVQAGLKVNSNAGLAVLARPTGGDVFENSNDLRKNFERLLHRQEVVYILGFSGAASHPGAFHRLDVHMLHVPRGSRASVRSGYFEGGGDSGQAAVLSDAAIIAADIPQSGIRMASLAAAVPTTDGRAAVPLIIDLDRSDAVGDSAQARIELFTYAFDAGGVVRDSFRQVLETKGGSPSQTIRYYGTLNLPPGKYSIRTLARVPQTGRKGYARTDIDVPASTATTVLPPLFLEEPGKSVVVRGVSHVETPFPFHINGNAFMPAAAIALDNGVPRRYVVYVYNVPAESVSVDTTLVDSSGARHALSPTLVGWLQGHDVTKLVYDITATGLPAGAGRMELAVHNKLSSDTRNASVPIVVEK